MERKGAARALQATRITPMAISLNQVWQVLRTDVREFWTPAEVAESGTEISKAALELGIAVGWLVSPPFAIAAAGLSFVGLGVKGIKVYREKFHKEPGLEECVAIAAPL